MNFKSMPAVKTPDPEPECRSNDSAAQPLRVLLLDDSEDELWLLEDELIQGGFQPKLQRVDTAPQMETGAIQNSYRLSHQRQIFYCVVIKHISDHSQTFPASISQLTCQD